jgi:hypothetical protein
MTLSSDDYDGGGGGDDHDDGPIRLQASIFRCSGHPGIGPKVLGNLFTWTQFQRLGNNLTFACFL